MMMNESDAGAPKVNPESLLLLSWKSVPTMNFNKYIQDHDGRPVKDPSPSSS